ncbi:MAG: NADH-ubiquinone oxidoreductase-F iron-sulfur binding region domain-containing protein [Ilumatobacteraceae bacterium]
MSNATAGSAYRVATAVGPRGLPRLLAGVASDGAVSLVTHRTAFPAPRRPGRHAAADLSGIVDEAGLRGRGGGSFPTATKMRAVAGAQGRPIVVVNGAEGEPASSKDRLLLARHAHLVIDGALLAAGALGADQVVVCIDRASTRTVHAVHEAITQRASANERSCAVRLFTVPPRFVAGEESALVSLLNGGEARPTLKQPPIYVRGVDNRPTLVCNVETFGHLAQIVNFGPRWFRELGTAGEPGTMLASISGDVRRPGVCEVPLGTPLAEVLDLAGARVQRLQAVLVGGYYGTWLAAADALDATLSNHSLRRFGAGVGCGALVALPGSACGITETARVLAWMAGESAGQCGPCLNGLAALAGAMRALAIGRAGRATLTDLHSWAGMVERRGACTFPDGAARLLRSALTVFAADVDHHVRHGVCVHFNSPPMLRVPAGGPPGPGDWR